MMSQVTIYTAPSCVWCYKLKEWLDKEGIDYKEVEVTDEPELVQEMMAKIGQRSVPLTTIGDEIIVGFDQGKIKALLNK